MIQRTRKLLSGHQEEPSPNKNNLTLTDS